MDTKPTAKESVSCPMDFILRMLMGPWTTYILYNLKTHCLLYTSDAADE